MTHTRHLIITCFLMLNAHFAAAAPVGNIGDRAIWNPGFFENGGPFSIIATLRANSQTNDLPVQKSRFNWANPNTTPAETRVYSQTRRSRNTLDNLGIQIGIPLNDSAYVYSLIGASQSRIVLHYTDWTVSRSFSRVDTFTSGPDVYYGVGAAFVMLRETYENHIPLTFGMTAQYLRYSLSDDQLETNNVSYSCSLSEIQLGLCLSTNIGPYSPYLGAKAASLTGKEDYVDKNDASAYFPEGYVHYTNDITWFKNIGYFIGVSRYFNDMVSVGLEIRFGDEEGLGLTATTRF
jgi:hypothetical protein